MTDEISMASTFNLVRPSVGLFLDVNHIHILLHIVQAQTGDVGIL